MQVYIEYAITDNFIVDCFLLYQTAVLLRVKYKKRFIVLSSLIGTAVAVVLPVVGLPAVAAFVVRLVTGLLMCYTAVRHGSFIAYVKFFNVFLLLTFFLGGLVIGIMTLIGIPYDPAAYYENKLLPIGLNVLFGYLLYFGIRRSVAKFVSSVMIAPDLYEAEVYVDGACFKATAFFDNGNRLIDERTGLPIIICSGRFFNKLSKGARLSVRGKMTYITASGQGEGRYYHTDYVVVRKGRVGFVRHAYIMPGAVSAVDAELVIGRALL